MSSFYEIDAFIQYNFLDSFSAKFTVNNITDNSFSIIKNFPMPGRNYLLSIGYEI
jgi:outer membrane cobalamin receptor